HTSSRADRGAELRAGFLVGLCLFTGYVTQTVGLKYTTAVKAGFLTGFYIVLVPVLSALVYRKLPRAPEVFGVLTATAGMVLMTLPGLRMEIGYGDALEIACAFAYAAHIVVLGHYSGEGRISFTRLSLYQIATVALLSAAACGWAEPVHVRWRPVVVVAIAVTGLLATALAFSNQTWAQQHTTPTRTALVFSLEPIFAWLTAYLAAGEALSRRAAVGATLILAGILLVELKPGRLTPHPSSQVPGSL
ncbi:MAG: DMT family transporter, partial [Bryobacteraceae bacterium]